VDNSTKVVRYITFRDS